MNIKWIVEYVDNTKLYQFTPEGQENLFKDIDLSKLRKFIILTDKYKVILDMKDGSFEVNGLKLMFEGFDQKNDFRLIYFKRIGQNLGNGQVDTKVFIGWQTTQGNKNHKRFLRIEENKITLIEN